MPAPGSCSGTGPPVVDCGGSAGPGLQADLLVNERASRRDMNQLQKRLGDYLAKEQIAWVLRELGITCVLDVGANVGQYAKMLRRAGYSGRIVSFEPLPHLAAVLRRESSADPDWIVVDCGLGSEDAEVDINVVPGTMSSMLEPSEFGEQWSRTLRDREHRTERIKVRRLDSVFDDAVAGLSDPRVYLKLDTQGFDLQAFEGAGEPSRGDPRHAVRGRLRAHLRRHAPASRAAAGLRGGGLRGNRPLPGLRAMSRRCASSSSTW